MRNLLAIAFLAAACTNNDPPSCQQAIAHYYEVGKCTYRDLNTGQAVAEDTMINNCQQLASAAPDNCKGVLDDWLVCNDSVSTAGTNQSCDCSQQQMAILECH